MKISICEVCHLQSSGFNTHNLVETIHVELSDEGGHVGVLVVVRQQGAGKLWLILYTKGVSFFCPTYEGICEKEDKESLYTSKG